MLRNWMVLPAVLMLLACQDGLQLDRSVKVPEEAEVAVKSDKPVLNPAFLPAHKLPWEYRVPGKADANTDFRKMHPQWYAITTPPAVEVRPMKEWEPMDTIVITYSNYLPGDDPVATTMADIVLGSLPAGNVWVIVDSDGAKADLVERIKQQGVTDMDIKQKVTFFPIVNDAIWMIDYGPFPVVSKDQQTVAFADWRYYHPRTLDDAIPTRLGNMVGATTYRSPFDFEGGNFQADGDEYCYFGERTYYYTGMNFADIEKINKDYFGCQKSVVLKEITDDGTGHIDMFFKLGAKDVAFMGEYTVVEDAANKQRMDDNAALLESLEYSDGSPGITVYRIPMPNKYQTVPRTFINSTLYASADGSYKVNLWPMYTVDKELEAEALAVWQEGLPDWDHVGVISDQISLYSGAVHCVTRTIPALPLAKFVEDGECVNSVCQGGVDGYGGACISQIEDTPDCWGPSWECLCNYCEAAGCTVPKSCGDGQCVQGEDCFNCPEDCACPNGTVCNALSGECTSNTCGNGICDESENCVTCAKDCACPDGEVCSFGICTANPCDGITYDGCCDGNLLAYCDGGDLLVEDCGADGCGWVKDNNWYACAGDGGDPTGAMPQDCHDYDYPPGCSGKECGDNGGGYSCGECEDLGEACLDGTCGLCDATVNCEGKDCGEDGCGGFCGSCEGGEVCEVGLCVCAPQCEGMECGDDGCGGSCGECQDGFGCDDQFHCTAGVTPEEDVIAEEDVAAETDVAAGGDTAGTPGTPDDDDDGGGCSTGAGSNPLGAWLMLVLLVGLGVRRRFAPQL